MEQIDLETYRVHCKLDLTKKCIRESNCYANHCSPKSNTVNKQSANRPLCISSYYFCYQSEGLLKANYKMHRVLFVWFRTLITNPTFSPKSYSTRSPLKWRVSMIKLDIEMSLYPWYVNQVNKQLQQYFHVSKKWEKAKISL